MDDNIGELPFTYPRAVRWAHTYNAYDRLATISDEGPSLRELLEPLIESFRNGGFVPEWAGVDLLRGWAFLLVRMNRHEDGWLLDEHPEMCLIADAITNHPAALESDLPPTRGEWE